MPLRRAGVKNFWLVILAAVLILVVGGAVGFQAWYSANLRPVSHSTQSQLFTVDEGSSAQQIASGLHSLGLIRSPRAFIFFVNSKNYRTKLQAGTYKFNPSMNAQEIAKKLATGAIDKNWLTILPGKRLDQVKQEFVHAGYTTSEIEDAFNPMHYTGGPTGDSAYSFLSDGATLEGFLYPDSFQKDAATPATAIIKESLDEMKTNLTPDIISGFAAQGLNVYQGVTLTSIVEQESGSAASQPTVAQVFLLRLKQGIVLGSDVTAFYASAIAHQSPSVAIDSPYNTRIHTGLPPDPIGNITGSALKAVAHPASTDYLFFVAGDDGVIHFSHTEAEHEAAVAKYCKKLCQ